MPQMITQLWLTLRSKAWFVAAYSAAAGTVGDLLYDEMTTGKLDLSPAGLKKMASLAVSAAVLAVIHLYRPTPPPKG